MFLKKRERKNNENKHWYKKKIQGIKDIRDESNREGQFIKCSR